MNSTTGGIVTGMLTVVCPICAPRVLHIAGQIAYKTCDRCKSLNLDTPPER